MFFYLANFGHLRGREKNKKPYLLKKKKILAIPEIMEIYFFAALLHVRQRCAAFFAITYIQYLGGVGDIYIL